MLEITDANPNEPVRVIIAGEGGVGKSTAAGMFPKPLFMPVESGVGRIKGTDGKPVKILKNVDSWDKAMSDLNDILKGNVGFGTLVIDSVTRLEKLCHKRILQNTTKSMKTIDGGYGAGSARQEQMFVDFIELLEQIRFKHDMHIVLIGHTTVKSAKDPSIEDDYDEFELDMDRKAAGILRQWCDALFYVRQNTFLKSSENKKGRVLSDDTLIAYTKIDPVFRAKNRFGMPKIVPFGFDFTERFFEYVNEGIQDESEDHPTEDLAEIKAAIIRDAAELKDEATKTKILSFVETLGDDVKRLKETHQRVIALKGEGK